MDGNPDGNPAERGGIGRRCLLGVIKIAGYRVTAVGLMCALMASV